MQVKMTAVEEKSSGYRLRRFITIGDWSTLNTYF